MNLSGLDKGLARHKRVCNNDFHITAGAVLTVLPCTPSGVPLPLQSVRKGILHDQNKGENRSNLYLKVKYLSNRRALLTEKQEEKHRNRQ